MEFHTKLFTIAIAITSMALAPSLIIYQPVDATKHCTDYGKSKNWVAGCQQGWWDHNHCNPYDPDGESNDFYNGYKVGWNKGECKSTPHYCTEYSGKSKAWIAGCKQGWWDHNHCKSYDPGTSDYAKGYKVGWSKGSCK